MSLSDLVAYLRIALHLKKNANECFDPITNRNLTCDFLKTNKLSDYSGGFSAHVYILEG